MLYCTGISKDYKTYLIFDTDDGVTEKVSYSSLKHYTGEGIVIENLQFDCNKFILSDMTFINNLLNTFKIKGQNSLTKLVVMRKDKDYQKQTLSKLANKLGLIPDNEDLTIDVEKCVVIFPWQHCIYDFSSLGNNEKIESIDVCDPKVVELSRLGFDAFNYMILNLGTKQSPNWVNLFTCFNELKQYDSYFKENYINYIGITPSNRMFKVYMNRFQIYSVQFCTVKELKAKFNKISNLGTTDAELWNYMRKKIDFGKDDDIAICKVSKKQYRKTVNELKVKYSTLQDVYKK